MYCGDTLLNRYNLNAAHSFKQRIKSKFGLSNAVPMYFARPSKDKFVLETNRYLRRLFENYATNKKLYKVVLDQSISPLNIKKTIRYVDGAKLILVDRDPRDIYATMINEKRLLGADNSYNNLVDKYIVWHNSLRKETTPIIDNSFVKNKVLKLNFEDFFINYDRTIMKIVEFLDIDFKHSKKGTRFQPERINNHVGIWKDLQDQNAVLKIEEKLSKYCFYE